MFVDFNILNQLGSPSINSNTFANRPAAGQIGRLFVSTDTFEIYRDNGTTWDLIGGPGSSTITGTGTATQVAYFTSSQAIGSSSNLYWDNTNIRLGIGTSTPGTRLDIHGTGIMQHINATGATANSLMAFQRTGTGLWRIGDTYNGGSNFFELHNTVLTNNAIEVLAASNEATFVSSKTYSSGNAIGVAVRHNLTIPNAVNVGLAAIGGVNSNLNLTLGGSTTVAATGRQGLEGSTTINFTGAGTLTMTQGSTVRAFSAISSVYAFNGSAVGTITHLAGLRICFPDNVGSAVNITNNYALLINNQTTGTGTVTYTNRWGIYQEGSSDLNYMAANLLLGSTVNNGNKLQVTGNGNLTGDMTADAYYLNGMTAGNGALYWTSDRVTLANYNAGGTVEIETNGGTSAVSFTAAQVANFASYINVVGNASTNAGLYVNNPSGISGVAQYYAEFKAGSTLITRLFRGNGVANLPGGGLTIDNYDGFAVRVNQLGGSGGLMTFTGGNFGINTINPLLSCQISALSGSQFALNLNTSDFVNSTSGTRILFGFGATTGNTYGEIATNASGGLSTANLVINNNGGNVLIGTTTDAGQKLQVNGSAYVSSTFNCNNVMSSNGIYNSTGTFVAAGSTTTSFYTIPNDTVNKIYLITVRQQGAGSNNIMGMAFAYTTSCTATKIAFNSTLSMDVQCTGNNIELVLGAGFGTTTWEWTVTIIKNV